MNMDVSSNPTAVGGLGKKGFIGGRETPKGMNRRAARLTKGIGKAD